jgi:hypothetical protein
MKKNIELFLLSFFTVIGLLSLFVGVVSAQSFPPPPGGSITCDDALLSCHGPSDNCIVNASSDRVHVYIASDVLSELTDCTDSTDDNLTNSDLAYFVQSALQIVNDHLDMKPLAFMGFVDVGMDYCTAPNILEPAIIINTLPCYNEDNGVCQPGNGAVASGSPRSCGTVSQRTALTFYKYSLKSSSAPLPKDQCPATPSDPFVNPEWYDHFRTRTATNVNPDFGGETLMPFFHYLLLHELGHVLGFDHPEVFQGGDDINSVVSYQRTDIFPQQFDHLCWEQYVPRPTLLRSKYRYISKASGQFWNTAIQTHGFDVEKGFLTPGRMSVGYGSGQEDRPAAVGNLFLEFSSNSFSSSAPQGFDDYHSMLPPTTLEHVNKRTLVGLHNLAEDPSRNVVIYRDEGTTSSSNNPFQNYVQAQYGNWTTGGSPVMLSTCHNDADLPTNSSNEDCPAVKPLKTKTPVVSAWDPYTGTTIHVSVQGPQNNIQFLDEYQTDIFIHPGFHSSGGSNLSRLRFGTSLREESVAFFGPPNLTLPSFPSRFPYPAHAYQGTTKFAPAIACAHDRFNWPYNCVLAWSDMGGNGVVLYTYFRVNPNGLSGVNGHTIEFYKVSGDLQVFKLFDMSVGHLAAAYTDGTFRIASKVVDSSGRTSIRVAKNNSTSYGGFTFDVLIPRQKWILGQPVFHYTSSDDYTGMMLGWIEYD